jgi:hypothetical protein
MSGRTIKRAQAQGWRDVAAALGGRYVEGGVLRFDGVEVARQGWTVTLDTQFLPTSKTTDTRVRAAYVSLDGLRFRVCRRHVLSGIGALLGLQDVEVGDAGFDHAFVIKASDEAKVRALLSDAKVRARIAADPGLVLAVQDVEASGSRGYVPAGAVELSCTLAGNVWDLDRLEGSLDLVAATLARLREIGSAPPAGLCGRCGYDLTGNVSGTCPECGQTPPPGTRQPNGNALADGKPPGPRRRKGARGRGTRRGGPA